MLSLLVSLKDCILFFLPDVIAGIAFGMFILFICSYMPGKPVKSFEPTEEEMKEFEELRKKYADRLETNTSEPKKEKKTGTYEEVHQHRQKVRTNLDYLFYGFIALISVGYLCARAQVSVLQLIRYTFPREYKVLYNLFHLFF